MDINDTRTLAEAIEDLAHYRDGGYRFLEAGPDGAILEDYRPFPEVHRQARQRAASLQAAGLGKGDRLAIVMPDTEAFVSAFLGCVMAGIVPVPIFPPDGLVQLDRYGATVAAILGRCEAKAVLLSSRLEEALLTIPGLPQLPFTLLTPERLDALEADFSPVVIGPDDLAFLQFTSGSTATPKGVRVSHRNIRANTGSIRRAFALTPNDVPVSWLPLFHDMGLIGFLLTTVYATVSTRFIPTLSFLKRPDFWLRAMSHYRGTIAVAPSFAFGLVARRLTDAQVANLDLSTWRIAGSGAEPVRVGDLQAFARRLEPAGFDQRAFLPMFGLAEATLAVTIPPLASGLRYQTVDRTALGAEGVARAPDSTANAVDIVNCGPAIDCGQIAIFAPDDEASRTPLPERTVGEIRVRGEHLFDGYWDDPEATAAAHAGDYLRTGDLGYLDQGELYVCGRIKGLIIVNGRNFFPDDIERIVFGKAGVRTAFAFQTSGSADAPGKVVLAAEVVEPERFDPGQLRHAVHAELGLTLDDIVPLEKGRLPKTSSGKPRRQEACRLYESGKLRPLDLTAARPTPSRTESEPVT